MNDQADTLRRIMGKRKSTSSSSTGVNRAEVITVASGKGGVGKSSLVANIGSLLARDGLRVLLVDGDFGLANLDILLGVEPLATVEQVLEGSVGVREAVVGVEQNLWLLPASSGFVGARGWEPERKEELSQLFAEFPWEMDLVLMDLGAGIQENVTSLHSPIYHSLIVVTPEPTSITDAYGLIKVLRRESGVNHLYVIVNQVTDGREASGVFQKLNDVASRFLDVELEYVGHCLRDEKFVRSVMKRKTLIDLDGGAAAIPTLELLAKRLKSMVDVLGNDPALMPVSGAGFWRSLLGEVKA